MQALLTLPNYSAVPVIVVTAHALPGDRERLQEAGFTNYVSKLFTRQQLLRVLRQVLAAAA